MNVLENLDNVRIRGRYVVDNGSIVLAYSAAYVEVKFHGTKAEAMLTSEYFEEERNLAAAAAVFINDEEIPVKRFLLENGTHSYVLFEGDAQDVTLRLMKYSEAPFATFIINALNIEGELLPSAEDQPMLIEFIGDSITCGYGIEGQLDKDVFNTAQENPWNAYACKTARKLHADFELISWSGNGLISQYIDPAETEARHDAPFMQELYPYADWSYENRAGKTEYTLWNAKREPDVIVLFLGTNDSSFARCIPKRNEMFVEAYRNFLNELREKHPQAKILCTLGTMDERLVESAEKAVALVKERGMKDVMFLPLPFQNAEEDGIGTDSHPSEQTHEIVSVMVSEAIQNLLN